MLRLEKISEVFYVECSEMYANLFNQNLSKNQSCPESTNIHKRDEYKEDRWGMWGRSPHIETGGLGSGVSPTISSKVMFFIRFWWHFFCICFRTFQGKRSSSLNAFFSSVFLNTLSIITHLFGFWPDFEGGEGKVEVCMTFCMKYLR